MSGAYVDPAATSGQDRNALHARPSTQQLQPYDPEHGAGQPHPPNHPPPGYLPQAVFDRLMSISNHIRQLRYDDHGLQSNREE